MRITYTTTIRPSPRVESVWLGADLFFVNRQAHRTQTHNEERRLGDQRGSDTLVVPLPLVRPTNNTYYTVMVTASDGV